MRILYISNSLSKSSGWDRYGFELAEAAKSSGHEILAAVAKRNESCLIKQEAILLPPLKYVANPLIAWSTARRLNRLIRDFRPDIIHFIVEPYVQILPFLKSVNAKTVLSIYGSYGILPAVVSRGFGRLFSSAMFNIALTRLDLVVGMGKYTASRFLESYPAMVDKFAIIKAGLSRLPRVSSDEVNNFKKKYILEQNYPILLTVGAIKQRKGQLDTLKSVKLLKPDYPNIKYVIIGSDKDSEYVESINSYARDSGLEDNLLILNSVGGDAELACAYEACDVFLLNSNNVGPYFEGFGLVILEANSFGKPAIGSSGCGIQDAIEEGINGLLVGQRDHEAIASAVRKMLKSVDPNACITYSESLSWKRTFDSYMELYVKKN